ncbi:MAG: TSUP family transporter [Corynebacterium sp.]|nr:TSUP family transporter [Corynebacterium sp.]
MDLELAQWLLLILGAGAAGWIDAVIGGGGLVLIPLIMAVIPGIAPATALASNKVAAVAGTSSAAMLMVRRVQLPVKEALTYGVIASACSATGALAVTLIQDTVIRPLIIVLLLAVGIFVSVRPQFGTETGAEIRGGWRWLVALIAAGAIGFYDGVFGPGTGMFLIMSFTAVFSQSFLKSAAMAKVVNTFTNLGGLFTFIIGGHIWWTLGLTLAVANILGAQLGARTVLRGGTKLIRFALLGLVVVMSTYLAWQQWG